MRKMFSFGGREDTKKTSVNKSGEVRSPDSSFSGIPDKTGSKVPTKQAPNVASLVCYHHKRGRGYDEISKLVGIPEEDVREIISEAKVSDVYDLLAKQLES